MEEQGIQLVTACRFGPIVIYAHFQKDHWVYLNKMDPEAVVSDHLAPFDQFLGAIASCTGQDTIYVMNKKNVMLQDMWMQVTAKRTGKAPRIPAELKVKYILVGPEIPSDKVERAIQLSQDKFCSVSNALKDSIPIQTEYEILTREEFQEKYLADK